ncbi:hypothetical protein, partial, partial [Absidia glauca]
PLQPRRHGQRIEEPTAAIKTVTRLEMEHGEDSAMHVMKKYGWRPGEGLGKSNQGARYPVATVWKQDRLGIGHPRTDRRRITHPSISKPLTKGPSPRSPGGKKLAADAKAEATLRSAMLHYMNNYAGSSLEEKFFIPFLGLFMACSRTGDPDNEKTKTSCETINKFFMTIELVVYQHCINLDVSYKSYLLATVQHSLAKATWFRDNLKYKSLQWIEVKQVISKRFRDKPPKRQIPAKKTNSCEHCDKPWDHQCKEFLQHKADKFAARMAKLQLDNEEPKSNNSRNKGKGKAKDQTYEDAMSDNEYELASTKRKREADLTQIIVPINIGCNRLYALVDTGCTFSSIDSSIILTSLTPEQLEGAEKFFWDLFKTYSTTMVSSSSDQQGDDAFATSVPILEKCQHHRILGPYPTTVHADLLGILDTLQDWLLTHFRSAIVGFSHYLDLAKSIEEEEGPVSSMMMQSTLYLVQILIQYGDALQSNSLIIFYTVFYFNNLHQIQHFL